MSKVSTKKLDEVKNLFTIYLEKHKLRKTNERYIILEEIYNRDDHFDAESLYLYLNKKNMGISRATVYNTLDLLVSGELVRKHQFGKNQNQYEKAYGYQQHDHLICIQCKKVSEFCDPRIQQIESKISDILNFNVTHHSLMLYGICEKCNKNKK
jgi:Fur family ferric uptake transcriptional regulator